VNAYSPEPLDRSLFASGACVRYPPLAGDRHLTVFLDAGHGGIDPGSIGETESGASIEEADLTLPIELDTMALLRAKGFTVVVSRTKATTVVKLNSVEESGGILTLQGAHDDVDARDICANMAKADALVGIYLDYGASPQNAGSVTAYDASRSFSAANLRLATLIQHDTLSAMNEQGWGIPDEGTLPDSQLGSSVPTDVTTGLAELAANYDHLLLLGPYEAGYQTTPSEMPGALIEPLYITDPFEGSIADSATGQRTIAEGIATGIIQYFTPARAQPSGHKKRATSG
jgi:N-acetylmuramoyl-L-alanine amidase